MGRSWASMMALQVIGSQFLGAFAGGRGSFALEGTDTIIVLTGKLPIKDHHLLWVGLQVSPLFSWYSLGKLTLTLGKQAFEDVSLFKMMIFHRHVP